MAGRQNGVLLSSEDLFRRSMASLLMRFFCPPTQLKQAVVTGPLSVFFLFTWNVENVVVITRSSI